MVVETAITLRLQERPDLCLILILKLCVCVFFVRLRFLVPSVCQMVRTDSPTQEGCSCLTMVIPVILMFFLMVFGLQWARVQTSCH